MLEVIERAVPVSVIQLPERVPHDDAEEILGKRIREDVEDLQHWLRQRTGSLEAEHKIDGVCGPGCKKQDPADRTIHLGNQPHNVC